MSQRSFSQLFINPLGHRFATTLATLSLSAAVALASANAVAQQPEHAHSADHSAGHGQQVAANNPAAQRKAAIETTESFINAHKQWAQSQGAANKAAALDNLIAKAEARREMLAELIKTNPAEALRVAIPEEKQTGMPAEVQTMLEQRFAVEGELEVQYADFEDGTNELRHYLKTPFGERFRLHMAGSVKEIKSGETVQIDGLLLDSADGETDGDVALQADDAGILTLALGGTGNDGEPGPVANTFGEQKTLVILVNFQDDNSQPWSKSEVQSLMDGQVSDFIQENSYGQTWLNTDVAGWFTIPVAKGTSCPDIGYGDLAEDAATAAGYNLANYSRLVYAWPRNDYCGYLGLGSVGGNPSQAWINGDFSYATVTHEIGHNLGLAHANDLDCGSEVLGTSCTVKSYGDYPNIMGSGYGGHFNAFQKDELGWLGYGNSPELTEVTNSGTYVVSPFETQDSSAKALKILKGIDPNTGNKQWYYLEYRQLIGFDTGLSSNRNQNHTKGIGVRIGTRETNIGQLLDMTPTSSYSHTDAALEAGNSYNDSDAGVSFSTDWADSSGAQVTVNLDNGGAPVCTRANPTLSVTPGESQWVAAGTAVSYSVTVTNRDSSACSNSSYSLARSLPSGWAGSFSKSSLSLAPGSTTSTTLTVTSATSAADGFYTLDITATSGSYSASSSVTYVVDTPATPVNSAPVAGNDSGSTAENTAVAINVLNNDSDPDGDTLTITSVSGVNGFAAINSTSGVITYTPTTGYTGTETFTYSVSDGKGGTDSATVTVVVSGSANQGPQALNDSATTDAGVPVTIAVLNNDSDPDGDSLTVTSFSGVNGSAVINNNGTITFTPANGFSGTETFSYVVSDGNGGTDSASVAVTVNAAPVDSNNAPIAVNDSVMLPTVATIKIEVLTNDSDPEGDALKVTTVTKAAKGTVVINTDGTVSYIPGNRFKNADSFSYTISDGAKTATATVSVQLQKDTGGSGGKGNGKNK